MKDSDTAPFVPDYLGAFQGSWTERTPLEQVRFVVLDTETTGTDPRTARLITIDAVAVNGGQVLLGDAFEEMIALGYTSSSVAVHGVTRDESRKGVSEAAAVESFLKYLRDGVIVGHHIGHDIETINRAAKRNFGIQVENQSLDTMDLALYLQDDGAFSDRPEIEDFSLDALCNLFNVVPHDRHTRAATPL